jgi:hypothetical protein
VKKIIFEVDLVSVMSDEKWKKKYLTCSCIEVKNQKGDTKIWFEIKVVKMSKSEERMTFELISW